ncbi:hypothetical protein D3C87_1797010 [compost metagenome]
MFEVRDGIGWSDGTKSKLLRSAYDSCRQLVGIGCCEDEYDVLWRLFEGFEECIKSGLREHVNLVNNIYFFTG